MLDRREMLEDIVAWLDKANGRSETEIVLRILKIAEELGETTQAYIGYTGQNPRKGKAHSMQAVIKELADVAFSALTVIQSLGYDATNVLDSHIESIHERCYRETSHEPTFFDDNHPGTEIWNPDNPDRIVVTDDPKPSKS